MDTNNHYRQNYQPPTSNQSSFAFVALIMGICSLLFLCCGVGFLFAALSVIFAALSRGDSKMNGQAKASIVLSIISLVISIFLFIGLMSNLFFTLERFISTRDYDLNLEQNQERFIGDILEEFGISNDAFEYNNYDYEEFYNFDIQE